MLLDITLWDIVLGFLLILLRIFSLLIVFRGLRSFMGISLISGLSAVLSLGCLTVCDLELWRGLAERSQFDLLLLAFRESLIGLTLGLPTALGLEIFAGIGRVVDSSRGAQFASQVVPGLGSQLSLLETLGVLMGLYLAFPLGGYRLLLVSLYRSLLAPLTAVGQLVIPQSLFSMNSLQGFIILSNEVIVKSVCYAAPVLIICFVVDVGTCILSRSLARINMLFELMPLKLMLGLLIISCIGQELAGRVGVLLSRAVEFGMFVLSS